VLEESSWYSSQLEVRFESGDPRISFRDSTGAEIKLVSVVDMKTDEIHRLVLSYGLKPQKRSHRKILIERGVMVEEPEQPEPEAEEPEPEAQEKPEAQEQSEIHEQSEIQEQLEQLEQQEQSEPKQAEQ